MKISLELKVKGKKVSFNDLVLEIKKAGKKTIAAKTKIFNEAIKNISEEAKEVAVSNTFKRLDEGWTIEYKDDTETGLINKITIINRKRKRGTYGASAKMLWNIMATGRVGYPDKIIYIGRKKGKGRHKPLHVHKNRFRSGGWYPKYKVILGRIDPTQPATKGKAVLIDGIIEFFKDIQESRWGAMRGARPRKIVRAIPKLYGKRAYSSFYKGSDTTEGGIATDTVWGEYGGSHRIDVKYPIKGRYPSGY